MFRLSAFAHRSPRTKIVALLLITGLPVLMLAVFGLSKYLEASKQDLVDDRIARAQAAALVTSAFVSDVSDSAQTLALSPEVTDPVRRDALPALLHRVRSANREWDQVAVLDAKGATVAATGALPIDAAHLRALLTRVQQSGLSAVDTSQLSPTEPKRLVLATPVNFADHTRGMLLVAPSVTMLGAEVRAQARGAQLQVIVVDASGAVLVGATVPAALTGRVALSGLLGAQADKREFDMDGVALLVTSAPVPELDWHVLIAQPSSVALAPVERQVFVAGIALLAALGLAGVLSWVLGDRMSVYYERLVEERRRAEEATLIRDAVLASVSHDLQNPITAAKGHLQILQRRLARDLNAPALTLEPGLKQAERAVVRMQVMVRELVDAARLGAGHDLMLVLNPADLVVLVREAVEEQAGAADGHQLVVESHLSEIRVSCDSERLARVLANLLSNAVKYSPVSSTVLIRVIAEDNAESAWATVTVSDRGIGIPTADLPHVFERFQRARNVGGSVMGAGLGLAGARMIVEQHGGTLDIFSIEGVGTTVVIRLPCDPLTEHQDVFPHVVSHPNLALHCADELG